MTASLLYPHPCELGEGSFWHAKRNSFFWVDIYGFTLYEYNLSSEAVNNWKFPTFVTMIAGTTQADELLLASTGKIVRFNLVTGVTKDVVALEGDNTTHRPNDGGVDPAGRLWIGTLHNQHNTGAGSLYSIDKDLTIHRPVKDLSIPNGLVWTRDAKTMYHIDSPTQKVQRYGYEITTGAITFEKTAIVVPREIGSPDGMCMDAEGMLWIAHWDGFGVYRWNPETGKLLTKIVVPVPQVSSCVFGGQQYDTLFITTARENMTKEDLSLHPDSGCVYTVKPGVKGYAHSVAMIG